MQAVDCLKKGSFQSGKILSDSKWVLNSLPEDTLHPAILNAVQNKEDFVTGVLGNPVLFNHPTIEDAVVKDAKQLGVHFEIDLGKEDSYLTYTHWHESHNDDTLTKRIVARGFAKAWNPLHEMGPLINPGKVCLFKIWSLQTFLQKRQIQTRFDYKEKGNYRPLANRKDSAKPRDWSTLQKQ